MFSKKDLYKLMIPLVIEQVLAVLVGMVDVVMVAKVGEAAVSAVSLVDSINILIIQMMAALATGGAVVAARYLGRKEREKACIAANQLLLVIILFSIVITAAAVLANKLLLHMIFGKVDAAVMNNAEVYFFITSLSYPFLGIYNGCAALFRSMGNSKVSMYTSLLLNGINIAGNAICIYGLKMGVEGVALPTLIARVAAAFLIFMLLRSSRKEIAIDRHLKFGYHPDMIKSILNIGIPNGLENSVFQLGKLLIQSLIAMLGTASIAGFAVASNIVTLQYLPGNAIGLGLITVSSQCIGAGSYEEAKRYTKQLIKVNYIVVAGLIIIISLFCRPLVGIYNLSGMASAIAEDLIWLHGLIMVVWPLAFLLPNTLRSASDVKFTMLVSIFSMWIFRIGCSYIMINFFDTGIIGIWIAMFLDWVFRAALFLIRFKSTRWQKFCA